MRPSLAAGILILAISGIPAFAAPSPAALLPAALAAVVSPAAASAATASAAVVSAPSAPASAPSHLRFDYLELRLPAPAAGSAASEAAGSGPAPFHLIFPDTLGDVPVRDYLEAPQKMAQSLLDGMVRRGRSLNPAERSFLKGLRSLANGRPSEAHAELAQALKGLEPTLKECLRIDAALLLYLAGLPEEAEKEWQRSLGVSSRLDKAGAAGPGASLQEGAWRNLYSLYLSRRDFKRAGRLVDDALQARPGSRWAQLAKGFLMRMLGNEEEWSGYLKDKSSWKDSLHGIQVAYGKYLADQGQWAEAIRYYNRGLEGSPGNGQAWLELADAYHHEGYLVFAEQCIQNAFQYGISDPYVFELYGKVLTDFGELADTTGVMRGLGFRLDTAWAGQQWRRAEKVVEEGFPKALHSRSMSQLLYRLYCRNGKVEAARTLRADFWFHFEGPALPARRLRLSARFPDSRPALAMRLSYIAFPLARKLRSSDFYEYF